MKEDMTVLSALRAANPGLPLYSVFDPEFAPYGRLLDLGETAALAEALRATPVPAEGNDYVAGLPGLEAVPLMAAIRRAAFGGMEVQAGYCNGRGFTMNAMEYHKCSEVNFTTTGLVLLLALPEQLRDGVLRAEDVTGFYLPPDTLAEIHPRVLHFAPCRVSDTQGFRCLVVLEKGTNAPLEGVDTAAPGETKLLWMQNKWLTSHPDSPQAKNGAFVGITGENITLKI